MISMLGGPAASAATASGGSGTTVDVTFSKWNESVTVTAPPADQVPPAVEARVRPAHLEWAR